MPIEIRFPLGKTFEFQRIGEEARTLLLSGLSYRQVAKILGVTDKTVKKAVVKGRR